MSSFLCFVCHSTVNADTNEETREKYREVIGMHLCPDSHLCFICCYFLNKMCMFKSICLKRSLEYPVLFSERGTINLQRSDIQVAILCPEDICLQHLNTRYHFYNNSENSQSDYGDNNYCQLHEENNLENNTDFHKDYLFSKNDCEQTKPVSTENFLDNNYFCKENTVKTTVKTTHTTHSEKTKKDAVLLELNSKIEVVIDLPTINDQEIEENNFDNSDNSLSNSESDNESQNSMNDEQKLNLSNEDVNSELQSKDQESKKKDFVKMKLTVKEQKKELEEARREEKYVTASYKCFNCAISFNFKDSYQAHMMRHEESNGEYSCTICSLRFANPAVLRSHARNHTERYHCTQCGLTVRARQRMTHIRACTGSISDCNTVYCDLCQAGFIGQTHLQQHIKRYHQAKNSNRTYLCNICGKSYNNQAAVRTHMITHINRKFSCDQCSSTFSSPYTLNQHKKKHYPTDQELHYCTICKIGYNTRKSLLAHLRNALAHKEIVYKCPVCPRFCPSLKALQAHTDALHARTNHLACEMCPAKYSTRKALVRHLRSHKVEGRKLTPLCHACGEHFKSTSILKRHLKNVCEKDKIEGLYYEQ